MNPSLSSSGDSGSVVLMFSVKSDPLYFPSSSFGELQPMINKKVESAERTPEKGEILFDLYMPGLIRWWVLFFLTL